MVQDIRTIVILDGPNDDLVAAGRSMADAVLGEAECFGSDQPVAAAKLCATSSALAAGRRWWRRRCSWAWPDWRGADAVDALSWRAVAGGLRDSQRRTLVGERFRGFFGKANADPMGLRMVRAEQNYAKLHGNNITPQSDVGSN